MRRLPIFDNDRCLWAGTFGAPLGPHTGPTNSTTDITTSNSSSSSTNSSASSSTTNGSNGTSASEAAPPSFSPGLVLLSSKGHVEVRSLPDLTVVCTSTLSDLLGWRYESPQDALLCTSITCDARMALVRVCVCATVHGCHCTLCHCRLCHCTLWSLYIVVTVHCHCTLCHCTLCHCTSWSLYTVCHCGILL